MALNVASAAEEQRAFSEDISRNSRDQDASDDLAQQAESSRNSSARDEQCCRVDAPRH